MNLTLIAQTLLDEFLSILPGTSKSGCIKVVHYFPRLTIASQYPKKNYTLSAIRWNLRLCFVQFSFMSTNVLGQQHFKDVIN